MKRTNSKGFSIYKLATAKGWLRVIANPFGRIVYIQGDNGKYIKNRDPALKLNRFVSERLGDLDNDELMLELL